MLKQNEKMMIGGAATIAVNSTIHFLVAKTPFKTPEAPKVGKNDYVALGLELGVSGLSYLVFGPVPAIVGGVEALALFGLRLAGVGPKAPVEEEEKPAPSSASLPAPKTTDAPAPKPAAPSREEFQNPDDFSGPEDFGNPEDFGGREDFANPDVLEGRGRNRSPEVMNGVRFYR